MSYRLSARLLKDLANFFISIIAFAAPTLSVFIPQRIRAFVKRYALGFHQFLGNRPLFLKSLQHQPPS
jgi:hypothetical protein